MTRILTLIFLFILPLIANARSGTNDLSRRDSLASDSLIVLPRHIYTSEQEIIDAMDRMPPFGIFQSNYFITGIPLNEKISNQTADAKIQISFRQRLTKSVLPFNTYLLFTYTQKSFWNIYEDSFPFADNNYNPAIALGRAIVRDGRLWGTVILSLEHESNGRDSIYSRSWNNVTFALTHIFNRNLSGSIKIWAGKKNDDNPDIYHYRGYGQLSVDYLTTHRRLWLSAIINPTDNFSAINTTFEANYKFNRQANQYFFVQWYNGYAEGMLNYKKHSSMLRIGMCIKPDFNR